MPFRDRGLKQPAAKWLLPVFVSVGTLAVIVWIVWALYAVGYPAKHPTTGTLLFIAGLAGIAMFILFSAACIIALIEATIFGARVTVQGEILAIVARLEAQGILRRAEAAASEKRDITSAALTMATAAIDRREAAASIERDALSQAADEQRHEEHMAADGMTKQNGGTK